MSAKSYILCLSFQDMYWASHLIGIGGSEMEFSLTTSNYHLRPIDLGNDNLQNYLQWVRDVESNQYILGVNPSFTLDELKIYVAEKNSSASAVLLGIYTKDEGVHIGNVKLEPLIVGSTGVLGILIGDKNMRGKGVGFEVITELLKYAFNTLSLEYISLGVHKNNLPAIHLYERIGFKKWLVNSQVGNSLDVIYFRIKHSESSSPDIHLGK